MPFSDELYRKTYQEIVSLAKIVECCEDIAWLKDQIRHADGRLVLLSLTNTCGDKLVLQLIGMWGALRWLAAYQLSEVCGEKPKLPVATTEAIQAWFRIGG